MRNSTKLCALSVLGFATAIVCVGIYKGELVTALLSSGAIAGVVVGTFSALFALSERIEETA